MAKTLCRCMANCVLSSGGHRVVAWRDSDCRSARRRLNPTGRMKVSRSIRARGLCVGSRVYAATATARPRRIKVPMSVSLSPAVLPHF